MLIKPMVMVNSSFNLGKPIVNAKIMQTILRSFPTKDENIDNNWILLKYHMKILDLFIYGMEIND